MQNGPEIGLINFPSWKYIVAIALPSHPTPAKLQFFRFAPILPQYGFSAEENYHSIEN